MLSGVSTRSTRGRLSGTAASRLPQHGAPTRRNRHVIRQTKRLSGQMIRCCKPCRRHRAHQKRFNSMRRRRRILFWMQFLTVERQHPVAPSRPKLAGGCPQLPVVAGGFATCALCRAPLRATPSLPPSRSPQPFTSVFAVESGYAVASHMVERRADALCAFVRWVKSRTRYRHWMLGSNGTSMRNTNPSPESRPSRRSCA